MKFLALILFISNICFALVTNKQVIFNNSPGEVSYNIDGGKTKQTCSVLSVIKEKLEPGEQKEIKLDIPEIQFLCININFGGKKSTLIKVKHSPECSITVISPDKIRVSQGCEVTPDNE